MNHKFQDNGEGVCAQCGDTHALKSKAPAKYFDPAAAHAEPDPAIAIWNDVLTLAFSALDVEPK